jgi:hypothetical protein
MTVTANRIESIRANERCNKHVYCRINTTSLITLYLQLMIGILLNGQQFDERKYHQYHHRER